MVQFLLTKQVLINQATFLWENIDRGRAYRSYALRPVITAGCNLLKRKNDLDAGLSRWKNIDREFSSSHFLRDTCIEKSKL